MHFVMIAMREVRRIMTQLQNATCCNDGPVCEPQEVRIWLKHEGRIVKLEYVLFLVGNEMIS